MKSATHNIKIENGSDFDMILALKNDDSSEYNLTGYTADMQIRTSSGTLILDCASYLSIQNTNEVNVSIPASATASITQTKGKYQIEILVSGKQYSLIRGNVIFEEAVIQ